MRPIAALSIADWNKRRVRVSTKGLIAVSFDQRNHGSREVDGKANKAWREGNETHAQDMYSIYRGTALDTSLLLDHVASYAFPERPIKISQNIVLGISLGGHSTWHVLLHDARFDTGVVVIGCPDYLRLMSDRARLTKLSSCTPNEQSGGTFVGSKDFPPDLVEAVKRFDPAGLLLGDGKVGPLSAEEDRAAKSAVYNLLGNKRILNMSGGADKLVPYHCSEPFIRWLQRVIASEQNRGNAIVLQDRVYEGVGHMFTPVMLEDAVTFISENIRGADRECRSRM
ncbi:hypothetical protein UCRPC4_g03512 [Phaeomoniella chlamydospora]|uniref:Uncharacterized protein n=1 Tax=Phaeomoniella chlamydospora TaxID=158046 RepID=A0A0G2EH65_PHACM|nr:hypothetical protein UCRPC4_g03512 [Phaeomoniella chlamydospora]